MNQLYENNVPLKIIVKYMLKLASFDKIINLINEKLISYIGNTYDNYIKLLYYGLTEFKFNSFVKEKLYLGTISKKREIEHGKNFLENSKCYCYNNGYLFFTLDENEAKQSMNNKVLEDSEDEVKVLFEIESGNDDDLKYVSNVEFKKYSNSKQKEILFFPYSSFEILKIDEIDGYYKIVLGYIGNHIKEAEKDNKNNKDNIIPTRFLYEVLNKKKLVSEKQVEVFKKELPQLIEGTKENKKAKEERKKETEKINKTATEKREKEKKEMSSNKFNNPYILSTYQINENQKKNIRILNCIEENGNDILNSIDKYLNEEKQEMSFMYKCNWIGDFHFKLLFNKTIVNLSNLFYECSNLIEVNFEHMDFTEVENMNEMFKECKILKEINLSETTTKVQSMTKMFLDCINIKKINLYKFKSKNTIKDCTFMFQNCDNLEELDLTDFEISNLTNTTDMFDFKKNNNFNLKVNPGSYIEEIYNSQK